MALNTFKCSCLTPLHFKGFKTWAVYSNVEEQRNAENKTVNGQRRALDPWILMIMTMLMTMMTKIVTVYFA